VPRLKIVGLNFDHMPRGDLLRPQPKCGFVIVGAEETIRSYDYEPAIRIQTRATPEGEMLPVDTLPPPFQNPIGLRTTNGMGLG